MNENLHTNVESTLKKYFKFDKTFDLMFYDQDPMRLYLELKEFKRDTYEPNYRFIFHHHDTDYYITKDQPGLLLRNLQRIVWSLDISNYFCLVLSQQDLQPELDKLRTEETSDHVSIACITHSLQDLIYLPRETTEINVESINKHYICLNRIRRFHRICVFGLLRYYQLLEKGIVSYGNRS